MKKRDIKVATEPFGSLFKRGFFFKEENSLILEISTFSHHDYPHGEIHTKYGFPELCFDTNVSLSLIEDLFLHSYNIVRDI